MKKTFGDYLAEGPDDKPDWMKIADPNKLSISDKASSENLYGSGTSGQYDMPSKKFQSAQANRMQRASKKMSQGYEQGPAINDMKAVLERLQNIERDLDGMADELQSGQIDPQEAANELDGVRKRVSLMVEAVDKIWQFFAVGGTYQGRK